MTVGLGAEFLSAENEKEWESLAFENGPADGVARSACADAPFIPKLILTPIWQAVGLAAIFWQHHERKL